MPGDESRRTGSRGVGVTNWLVSKTAGLLERRTSRRGFLIGSAMAGSAVAVAGCVPLTRPGPPYTHITDCAGGLCTDGYTEFCCTINDGINGCPPNSFWGGWWRADYSTFCNGTRYYIDCMEYCCGPATGYQNFCAGCNECRCAAGCDTRHVYCNYFRYGQCHTDIVASGPISCRVVTCVPPYAIDPACSSATLVDNATAEHTSPCITSPPVPLHHPAAGASPSAGVMHVFSKQSNASIRTRTWDGSTWTSAQQLSPLVISALTAASDASGSYVFGRGFDGAVWYNRHDGTAWTGQQKLPGLTISSDPVAIWSPSGIYLFALDGNKALWHGHFDAGVWSGWFSLQGTWTKDIAAVSSNWGIFVFARGTDDGVYYRRLTGGGWGAWTSLAGQTSAQPAVAANGNGVYLVVRAQEALWSRRWNGTNFENWVLLGANATGNPAAGGSSAGAYAFVRSKTDSSVWVSRNTGGSWGAFTSLNWASNASPAAVVESGGGAVHLFVRGNDNNLYWGRMLPAGFTGFLSLGGPVAVGDALV
jgi:hypothetical protein